MTDDLISRKAAIEALYDGAYLSFEKRNELIDRMNRIPTASPGVVTMKLKVDAEAVKKAMQDAELTLLPAEKKGKWIDYCGGVKCDQCGFECDDAYYLGEANYCPNCGARMEESE